MESLMKKLALLILVFISALAASTSHAFADMKSEITHLLNFVEHSKCDFIRNGSSHSGPDARNHMMRKYDYFKERISSAEEFIEYSATKSTMSGKPYKVRCDGKEYLTAQWLNDELKKYRVANPAK